jgi:hypothetical protein
MIAKFSSLVLAAIVSGSATVPSLRPPIDAAGDSVALNFAYVGHVSPDGGATRLTSALHVSESDAAHATVTIQGQDGKTKTIDASVQNDGEITSPGASDLVTIYNTIPLVLRTTPGNLDAVHAKWSAAVPVKVSQTEWKNVPVTVVCDNQGKHADLTVTGTASNIVVAHGFTVGEDVRVNGNLTFVNGAFVTSHFNVHEVVHTYTDIPIDYDWTMSR